MTYLTYWFSITIGGAAGASRPDAAEAGLPANTVPTHSAITATLAIRFDLVVMASFIPFWVGD
jgi:hypothetical protein